MEVLGHAELASRFFSGPFFTVGNQPSDGNIIGC
jgi:hypothetical protein